MTEQMTEQKALLGADSIPRKTVIVTLPSGEIRLERGADSTYLIFDCDCLDALPYCKAQCCGIAGTIVREDEWERIDQLSEVLQTRLLNFGKYPEMKRDADGQCAALDRDKCLCMIYDSRPKTCKDFHCSRGHGRGWDIGLIRRQKEYEIAR